MELILGILLGFLSGLGTGGGSLLIIWLTEVRGMAPEAARILNLMFFLPAAAIAVLGGKVRPSWKRLLPVILAGCGGAALGAWIGQGTDLGMLRKLFGGLLIFTGIRELLWKQK